MDGDLFGFILTSGLSDPDAGTLLSLCFCHRTLEGADVCACSSTFTASESFSGSVTLTYRAVDAEGLHSADATVRIRAVAAGRSAGQVMDEIRQVLARAVIGGSLIESVASSLGTELENIEWALTGERGRVAQNQAGGLLDRILRLRTEELIRDRLVTLAGDLTAAIIRLQEHRCEPPRMEREVAIPQWSVDTTADGGGMVRLRAVFHVVVDGPAREVRIEFRDATVAAGATPPAFSARILNNARTVWTLRENHRWEYCWRRDCRVCVFSYYHFATATEVPFPDLVYEIHWQRQDGSQATRYAFLCGRPFVMAVIPCPGSPDLPSLSRGIGFVQVVGEVPGGGGVTQLQIDNQARGDENYPARSSPTDATIDAPFVPSTGGPLQNPEFRHSTEEADTVSGRLGYLFWDMPGPRFEVGIPGVTVAASDERRLEFDTHFVCSGDVLAQSEAEFTIRGILDLVVHGVISCEIRNDHSHTYDGPFPDERYRHAIRQFFEGRLPADQYDEALRAYDAEPGSGGPH